MSPGYIFYTLCIFTWKSEFRPIDRGHTCTIVRIFTRLYGVCIPWRLKPFLPWASSYYWTSLYSFGFRVYGLLLYGYYRSYTGQHTYWRVYRDPLASYTHLYRQFMSNVSCWFFETDLNLTLIPLFRLILNKGKPIRTIGYTPTLIYIGL